VGIRELPLAKDVWRRILPSATTTSPPGRCGRWRSVILKPFCRSRLVRGGTADARAGNSTYQTLSAVAIRVHSILPYRLRNATPVCR